MSLALWRTIDAFCYLHDVFPTICDMVKISTPSSVTGRSMLSVINRSAKQIRDFTYHAYMQFQRAYRKGDYKLIEYVRAKGSEKSGGEFIRGSRVTQLFRLKADPWETLNLAMFPEHQQRIDAMRKEMREASIILGDTTNHIGTEFDFWDFY